MMYVLRIVSPDTILYSINTSLIIIPVKELAESEKVV